VGVESLLNAPSFVATNMATARQQRATERTLWGEQHPEVSLPRSIEDDGPSISVVVTAHNVGPWIGELLGSLQVQTCSDLEVVIVDDHSTDETSQIIADYVAGDPRFRVVTPHFTGGGNSRNVGADHARGRYLAFCDGDDIVPEHAYERLLAAARGNDIVFGGFIKFFPTRSVKVTQDWPAYASARHTDLGERPGLVRHRAVWNKLFDTRFWRREDIVFAEAVRSNDIVPMTQAYLAADRLAVIEDVVYLYRARPGASSMTSQVGSLASLVSYLTQELACRALVANDAGVSEVHQRVFAQSDGWVQVGRYVDELAGSPPDPEVVDLVRALWAGVGESVRVGLDLPRRSLFQTLSGRDPAGAWEVMVALNPTAPVDQTTQWCQAWSRLWRREDLPELIGPRAELLARAIVPGLAAALRRASGIDSAAEPLRELLVTIDPEGSYDEGLFALDRTFHCGLRSLRDGEVDLFVARVHRGRGFAFTVSDAVSRAGSLEIHGQFNPVDDFVPEGLSVNLGRESRFLTPVTVTGEGTWSAVVSRRDLPLARQRRLNAAGRFAGRVEEFDVGHTTNRTRIGGSWLNRGVELLVSPASPRSSSIRWQPPVVGWIVERLRKLKSRLRP
jgi:hypothetical protein